MQPIESQPLLLLHYGLIHLKTNVHIHEQATQVFIHAGHLHVLLSLCIRTVCTYITHGIHARTEEDRKDRRRKARQA